MKTTLKLDFQEGDLPSLHPHALMIYLRGLSVAKTLFEGLTRIDAQGKAELAGAASVDVSPDKLRYTFTLRKNTWSDGTPVTAFHYEQAWKEALSPTSFCSRADLLYMIKNAEAAKKGTAPLNEVGVKATNDTTLVVDLAYPSPHFLELVAQPICFPLVDPKRKEPQQFNGPFLVDMWKKGDYLRLKPNTRFWDSAHISLKQIDIYMVQDPSTTFSLYEKGEIDWIGAPLCPLSTELILHLKKELKTQPVDRTFWVFLNTQHPALKSAPIRQALSMAIERKAITDHILLGSSPLYKPLSLSLLSSSFSPVAENLTEARACFSEGLKELGYTQETFPPLIISYSQQANRKQVAEYLQQAWSKAFHIPVKLEPVEWNVLRGNLEKGQFEISGCFEAAFYKDPIELLERFSTLNPCNFPQWSYPLFAEKVSLAKREANSQKRIELAKEAEKILAEQTPFIPVSSDSMLFTHPPELKGYVFDYVGAIDFSRASF